MTVWILVLVYVLGGQVRLEASDHKTMEACIAAGNAIVAKQVATPGFGPGLFGDCVPVERVKV